jgi:DNA-binding LacI/PurR family transcriptional regulator
VPSRPTSKRPASDVGLSPVTSTDIARMAGVSRSTVSLILNDQDARFSPDTVERVRACAATLGYVRSAAGRALVKGHSDFIVLVVPYSTFVKLQEVAESLSADLAELGFSTVVHFNMKPAGSGLPSRLHHLVQTLRPAGVIDLGGLSEEDDAFLARVGCPAFPRRDVEYNARIGRVQADHLFERGYTELAYAFLSDARDDPFGAGRAEGVAEFCAAKGLAVPARIHVPIEPDGALRALDGLLAVSGRPLGVACYNDEVAVALLFAAQRLGLAVPRDVAIMGAEGFSVGQVISPRLTTVVSDVTAILAHIRYSLAEAYARMDVPREVPTPTDAYSVLLGETT